MEVHDHKRGSESPAHSAKRGKILMPSRVIHIANIPDGTSEAELVQLCGPFGRVLKHLILYKAHQAFVEMEDINGASQAVAYFQTVVPVLRGVALRVQFSTHESLNLRDSSEREARLANSDRNKVLLVTITNVVYPMTVDVIHQVFHKFGEVLRIVVFSKNGLVQALVEFSSAASAHEAKELNDQNIYSGCCTLDIIFSNLKTVTVRYQNDLSRDYTDVTLPAGAPTGGIVGVPLQMGGRDRGLVNAMPPHSPQPLYSQYGMGNQFGSQMSYPATRETMAQEGGGGAGSGGAPGRVCMVANLDERATPDILFTVFGMYGDVVRVKILFNKKDVGLVEFNDPVHCQRAVRYLNHLPLLGKQLTVKPSPHSEILVRKDDSPEFTQSYVNSPLHRFRYPDSKNEKHICAPSCVLHLSNLPEGFDDERIVHLMQRHGTVLHIKRFPSTHKMALVEMDSIESAVAALVGLHNYSPNSDSKMHMRVSFSATRLSKSDSRTTTEVNDLPSALPEDSFGI